MYLNYYYHTSLISIYQIFPCFASSFFKYRNWPPQSTTSSSLSVRSSFVLKIKPFVTSLTTTLLVGIWSRKFSICRILKKHWHDAVVYQISLVDTGNALCDHTFYTQIHWINGCMLSGRALTIVFTTDNDTGSHFSCSFRKLSIISVVAVFGHQRDIGTHAGKFRAGRCYIVSGNVVAAF